MKWWWFVLGAIVGWLVSWLLELFYWRWKRQARITELEAQLRGCNDQVATLQGELTAARAATVKPAAPLTTAEVKTARPVAAVKATKAATPKPVATPKPAKSRPTAPKPVKAAEAKAAPKGIPAQDLAAIHGIGPIFEQKLYEAGIGTFSELAALSETRLKAIIQPQDWQEFHYETWNEQARKLAEKTGTTGAVWNGIIPDDLTAIKGIGEVSEQRLYDAGVLTFADLASKTAAELEAIIQPRNWQKVDLAAWIAQARDRAGGKVK